MVHMSHFYFTRKSILSKFMAIILFKSFYLFIYFWLCWVCFAALEFPLVASIGSYSLVAALGLGFSFQWLLLLQSTGSKAGGSVVAVLRLSCSVVSGIILGQGSNPSPLHWRVDSWLLSRQGSPMAIILNWWELIVIQDSSLKTAH